MDSEQEDHVINLLSYYPRVMDITQERDEWVDSIYLDLKRTFDKEITMEIGIRWEEH